LTSDKRYYPLEATPSTIGVKAGLEQGVLKGVFPLHGVTEPQARHEGAWPPRGSMSGLQLMRLRVTGFGTIPN